MNNNQKLRFLIDKYGELIGISEFYELYKVRYLKIEKAEELNEDKKEEIIQSFSAGIKELEDGMIQKYEAKLNIIDKFISANK